MLFGNWAAVHDPCITEEEHQSKCCFASRSLQSAKELTKWKKNILEVKIPRWHRFEVLDASLARLCLFDTHLAPITRWKGGAFIIPSQSAITLLQKDQLHKTPEHRPHDLLWIVSDHVVFSRQKPRCALSVHVTPWRRLRLLNLNKLKKPFQLLQYVLKYSLCLASI
jgi:hypothetical protein